MLCVSGMCIGQYQLSRVAIPQASCLNMVELWWRIKSKTTFCRMFVKSVSLLGTQEPCMMLIKVACSCALTAEALSW